MNKWISRLAREKQPVKKPRIEHITRIDARLLFSWLSREKGQPLKDLRKSLFGKKLFFALQLGHMWFDIRNICQNFM